jgi:hypothetical protein
VALRIAPKSKRYASCNPCNGWTRRGRNGKWGAGLNYRCLEEGDIEARIAGTVVCFGHSISSRTQGSKPGESVA